MAPKDNMRLLVELVRQLAEEFSRYRQERTAEFECMRSHSGLATKHDLGEMEKRILMKQSEVKALVAQAAQKSTEAFTELGTRIADLQKQIADLIAGAGDPDVTDEAFLADLNTLKTNTDALADIVPNTTP